MDSKRSRRREFLKGSAALVGGLLGAAAPAIGQTPASPPMIKGDKDLIAYGIRSRFVDELPLEHIEIVAELGLQPGASWDSGWGSTIEVPSAPPWQPAAPLAHGTRPWAKGPRPLLVNSAPVPRRGEEVRRVGGFAVGTRVFHQKFGYGTITEIEDNKLAIHFDVAGNKKVMDAFVERA